MQSYQVLSNAAKVKTGQAVKSKIASMLEALRSDGLILDFDKGSSFSHKKYNYSRQFKVDFIVKTIDLKFILIQASNSYRSDRVKSALYDFLGIQEFSSYQGNIVASILVFPDGEERNSNFIATRNQVREGVFFSPATHWLTYKELSLFFKTYSSESQLTLQKLRAEQIRKTLNASPLREYQRYFINHDSHKVSDEKGSYYGKSGFSLERFLVKELNDFENLHTYKAGKAICYEVDVILKCLASEFSICSRNIGFIVATDTIPRLTNGGASKTDLHLKIYLSQDYYLHANISIKNTSSTRVSCHDYQAQDFARVIAPDDQEFREVIVAFQDAGSWTRYDTIASQRRLSADPNQVINRHIKKIIDWAITGQHDIENVFDQERQIANFLFTRNASTGLCKIQSTACYIEEISKKVIASRGAPFSWTYPSKQRGHRIQLKMPIELP